MLQKGGRTDLCLFQKGWLASHSTLEWQAGSPMDRDCRSGKGEKQIFIAINNQKASQSLRTLQMFETNYTLLLTVGGGPNRRSVENISLSGFGNLGGIRKHTFQKLTMGKLYTVCK